MKKLLFCICTVFIVLSLSSCKGKLAPQDPEIKLSEEHGKMLNLIMNLHQSYSDWSIDLDTSSDNYIYEIYYSDFEKKMISYMSIIYLQYCNGIITDISNYNYYDGNTFKRVYYDCHVRWTDSNITVTTYYGKCKYPLNNPDSLLASARNKYSIPAVEITKIDDDEYRYIHRIDENGENDYSPWGADFGENYIEFDTLQSGDKFFDVIRIFNKVQTVCCKFYLNNWLKRDSLFSHDGIEFNTKEYIYDNGNLAKGIYYTYSEGSTLFKLPAKEQKYPFTRKYDDAGHLVYEEQTIEDNKAEVKIVSKRPLDIKEICTNFDNPVNLETKRIDK